MKFITGLWNTWIQDGCYRKPCYVVSYVSVHHITTNVHHECLMSKEREGMHDLLWAEYEFQQAVQHFTGSTDSPGRVCQSWRSIFNASQPEHFTTSRKTQNCQFSGKRDGISGWDYIKIGLSLNPYCSLTSSLFSAAATETVCFANK